MINNKYDVVIIGGGIGGLCCAYQLIKNNSQLKIAILDKGHSLHHRICPAQKTGKCIHCKTCSITTGFAGAGAFSDGKFNLGLSYGGTLGEELGEDISMNYIEELDELLYQFSVNAMVDYPDIYVSNEELKSKCTKNNLTLLDMNVRHLGTDRNYQIMNAFIKWLNSNGIDFYEDTEALNIIIDECYTVVATNIDKQHIEFLTKKIIIATGRAGGKFLSEFCNNNNIPLSSNKVDIGVRVEMKDSIWEEFSSKIYEPKILYKTPTFWDNTRMFCFNKQGFVASESNNNIITANGHSYSDVSKKSENCNFAILSSIKFTEPFDSPIEYCENISKLANDIGDNNVLVQRFGDLIRGRRTTEERLKNSKVIPTLKATPGDIGLVLPYRILTNIIETIYALDRVAKGTADDDTLLYACESKYYSVRPDMTKEFKLRNAKKDFNIYCIGDGSGITRGLSQAGAMGLYVADCILKEK
jgi:uncharacterized FAD-dependent dehydrogenase